MHHKFSMANGQMTYKYLKFFPFQAIPNWSVANIQQSKFLFNPNIQLEKIGNLIKRSKDRTLVKDDVSYKRVTVRLYNKGVVQRDEVLGKNIGTKTQYHVREGQFIMSKIDARNGAFGIIPTELDGAIITQDFLTFDINENKIIPYFFVLLTYSSDFRELCQRASSGTTGRQRVNEQAFLNFKIPLPPLKKQKRLIEGYKKKIDLADNYEKTANKILKDIEDYFLLNIGVVEKEKKENKNFYFVKFSSLTRWDVWNLGNNFESTKYPFSEFRTVITKKPQYGANVRAKKELSDVRYIRITDIQEDGTLADNFVSAEKVENQYFLNENDLLIARSGNTVGKTLLYKQSMGKAIFAGYLIRFNLNLSKANPDYIFYYTKSKPFKNWVDSNKRVSAQPNINGQEYLTAPIVLPPMKVQLDLVNYLKVNYEKIAKLKQDAELNRKQAISDFEKAIFKTKETA